MKKVRKLPSNEEIIEFIKKKKVFISATTEVYTNIDINISAYFQLFLCIWGETLETRYMYLVSKKNIYIFEYNQRHRNGKHERNLKHVKTIENTIKNKNFDFKYEDRLDLDSDFNFNFGDLKIKTKDCWKVI